MEGILKYMESSVPNVDDGCEMLAGMAEFFDSSGDSQNAARVRVAMENMGCDLGAKGAPYWRKKLQDCCPRVADGLRGLDELRTFAYRPDMESVEQGSPQGACVFDWGTRSRSQCAQARGPSSESSSHSAMLAHRNRSPACGVVLC
ncbi:hypothetical protein KILIM_032_00230 [Kineosphaera limosa NBRC 100340]|uniref:Uncharacterized protein n=1 Tax=Kineosphaera limosa NBRC 100340 TaxID=1184609 RepID=K6VIS3_9MICO|nr:hypothetical protein KILIM_032_00230 [Kineosphaera limosa NBRC 100340]